MVKNSFRTTHPRLITGLMAAVITVCLWLGLTPTATASTQLTWLNTAPTDTSGFRKATTPRTWQFPTDFGPHEDYQTEWWYYTGNLATADGRPFGFQLTFFRQALMPAAQTVATVSQWRSNQIYSAHFTISDIVPQQFYVDERFSRGTLGLAGAQSSPYQVWLENWSATEVAPGQVRLQAATGEVALDLLVNSTPPILQGNRGLSIKGSEPGNASYYYSLVQQPTQGTVRIKDKSYAVSGLTWKDHEYSTSSLSPGTVGWDWFSMQFDNGSALMLYLLRHEDGSIEDTSAGTFISASGDTTPLSWHDWQIQVVDTWTSSHGATYPAEWQIAIPKLDLALHGRSLMPNQELNTATATYWEGAVAFEGQQQNQPLTGKGYVELTGYADRLDALLSARTAQVSSR